jgi:ABC-type transporter Mla subunit MlaD
MASPSERTRNNVRAGVFVSVAIVLAVATIIVLTDALRPLLHPRHEYEVTFPVTEGVNNLKEGAEVLVGGVLMGEVTAVEPQVEGETFEEVVVTFAVDRRVELYVGADISISSAVIGANAWLVITKVGDPEDGEPPGRRFEGKPSPIMGGLLGAVTADDTEEMVTNLKETTVDVKELAARINREDWPRWSGKVDTVMDWAETAPDRINAVLDEGRGLFTDAREVVAENREKISTTADNLEAATGSAREVAQRFEQETMDKVDSLLNTGQEALGEADSLIEDAQQEFELWKPEVRDALASARLTGQQLKLAAIEIRRSPWKLLYRPTRTELEHEMLYEATRSFALAASDLKAASESARRIVEHYPDELALDAETQKLVNEFLQESIEHYQAAQGRLADVLFAK